jgi:hypothetical protein
MSDVYDDTFDVDFLLHFFLVDGCGVMWPEKTLSDAPPGAADCSRETTARSLKQELERSAAGSTTSSRSTPTNLREHSTKPSCL